MGASNSLAMQPAGWVFASFNAVDCLLGNWRRLGSQPATMHGWLEEYESGFLTVQRNVRPTRR
jgi:hypothetical protein